MFKAHEMPFKTITGVASAAIERYALVTVGNDGCVKPAATGEYILGVAQQSAKVGQEVPVMVHGVAYAKASVKVVPGDKVDASTGLVAKASGASSIVVLVGAEANEMCSIFVK